MTKDEYKQLYEQVCEQYDVLAKELATIKQARALDKMAENARELGLDYEPAPMAHIVGEIDHGGTVWTPAQPAPIQDIPDLIAGALGVSRGTAYDLMREALKEAATVQEPVHQWQQKHSPYWYDGYPDNDDGGGPYETRTLYTTPPPPAAQPAVPLTDEQKRDLIKKSALWDMHIHIGWYSAPAKSFVEKTIQLIADIEAAHGITKGKP